MKKYEYLIVGAGITGATIANLLHQKGKKCLVLESGTISRETRMTL